MRRLLGYLVIAIGLMWLVSGCALWPSAFDGQEHARLVNIQVASRDSSVCANPEQVKAIAQSKRSLSQCIATLNGHTPMAAAYQTTLRWPRWKAIYCL